MKKILSKQGRLSVVIIFLILTIVSAILILKVKVNYDLTNYLPNDSQTKEGFEILEKEFGNNAIVQIMFDDLELLEVVSVKNKIKETQGVLAVKWLDDYIDITNNDEKIDFVLVNQFYKDGKALMTIVFNEHEYSQEVEKVINVIESKLTNYNYYIRGQVLQNINLRNIANKEMFKIMIIIIPIIILILLLAAKTWFEPVIILLTLGSAIALNMGTNIFFKDVSFITQSMAMALQLAVSLDYSLFLIHRYYEERQKDNNISNALLIASKKALPSVAASALTTVMGFIALVFMRYKIGLDIGLVLAKGVILSFISVMILMPVLILIFNKLLEKPKGFNLNLKLGKLTPFFEKFKYGFLVLFVLIISFSFIFQSKANFTYGNNDISDKSSKIYLDNQAIKKEYGVFKPIVILAKNDSKEKELGLLYELMHDENIIGVESLYTIIDPNIPLEFVPDELKGQFIGQQYFRIIIYTNIEIENEKMYQFSDKLNELVNTYYEDYYLLGVATSTTEIKKTVLEDTLIVTLFSIIAVGLVILFVFRSLSVPFILLLVIEAGIWINMSIVYFSNLNLVYIGYLVIITLQLGATIDYAVLLTNRYLEFRQTNDRKEAMVETLNNSSNSVIISALILAVAGFAEGFFSKIQEIQEIGLLIGRGALLSCLLVLVFLPPLLLVFDKLIFKKTNKLKE